MKVFQPLRSLLINVREIATLIMIVLKDSHVSSESEMKPSQGALEVEQLASTIATIQPFRDLIPLGLTGRFQYWISLVIERWNCIRYKVSEHIALKNSPTDRSD
mmetsp:Transcript_14348/g.34759  ORF Transcript_14348/g.34759 Transcript_14348/m.34759 type:complete len:104 (-) Transcript_14348:718-1029(-)